MDSYSEILKETNVLISFYEYFGSVIAIYISDKRASPMERINISSSVVFNRVTVISWPPKAQCPRWWSHRNMKVTSSASHMLADATRRHRAFSEQMTCGVNIVRVSVCVCREWTKCCTHADKLYAVSSILKKALNWTNIWTNAWPSFWPSFNITHIKTFTTRDICPCLNASLIIHTMPSLSC